MDFIKQYIGIAKIVVVLALAAALFLFGRTEGIKSVQPALSQAKLETATVKTAWATEKAQLNAEAVQTLADAVVKVRAEEKAQRLVLEQAQVSYRKTIKELKDEKARMDTSIVANGLWFQSTRCESTVNQDSNYALEGAGTNSLGSGTLYRCKLPDKTALDLSQLVYDADELVVKYGRCLNLLTLERKE